MHPHKVHIKASLRFIKVHPQSACACPVWIYMLVPHALAVLYEIYCLGWRTGSWQTWLLAHSKRDLQHAKKVRV